MGHSMRDIFEAIQGEINRNVTDEIPQHTAPGGASEGAVPHIPGQFGLSVRGHNTRSEDEAVPVSTSRAPTTQDPPNDGVGSDPAPILDDQRPPLSWHGVFPEYHVRKNGINWEALLTGHGLMGNGAEPPMLNLTISEARLLAKKTEEGRPVGVDTVYDTDSVLFMPRTLGVFKKAFKLSVRPSFLRSVQSNPYVKWGGHDARKTMCVLFGTFDIWDCHVFFPNMKQVSEDEHGKSHMATTWTLSDHHMRVWMDEIVLPALRSTCTKADQQRYHPSFDCIVNTANVKSETSQGSSDPNHIQLQSKVQPANLGPLWDAIVARAASVTGTSSTGTSVNFDADAFSSPFLVVSAHNLKDHDFSRSSRPSEQRTRVLDGLAEVFNMGPRYIDLYEFWLDDGQEEVPDQDGITLLRKQSCSVSLGLYLADGFHKSAVKMDEYPWAGTNAGSITAETKESTNTRARGTAQFKAYNIIKEQFSTPSKGQHPFSDPLAEGKCAFLGTLRACLLTRSGLSYSSTKITRWWQLRRAKIRGYLRDRSDIITCYRKTKNRLTTSLHDSSRIGMSYGVRREKRRSLANYLMLEDEELDSIVMEAARGKPDGTHCGYWILPTQEVNDFRIAECNRWLLCLEAIILSANPQPGTNRETDLATQDANSFMLTAMNRVVQLSLGCLNPLRMPELWVGKILTRGRFKKRTVDKTQKRRGLDLKKARDRHHMLWLPLKLGHWTGPVPYFTRKKMKHLGVGANSLSWTLANKLAVSDAVRRTVENTYLVQWIVDHAEEFKSQNIVVDAQRDTHKREMAELEEAIKRAKANNNNDECTRLTKDAGISKKKLAGLEHNLRETTYLVLTTCVGYVVRQYNLWVWDELYKRWAEHETDMGRPKKKVKDFQMGMTEDTKKGYTILTKDIVFDHLRKLRPTSDSERRPGLKIDVGMPILARVTPAAKQQQKKNPAFPEHASGLWKDRIHSVFCWEEPARKWAKAYAPRASFVQMGECLKEAVGNEHEWTRQFLDHFADYACFMLFFLIFYNGTSAALTKSEAKTGPHKLSKLERTQFMQPRISLERAKKLRDKGASLATRTWPQPQDCVNRCKELLVVATGETTVEQSLGTHISNMGPFQGLPKSLDAAFNFGVYMENAEDLEESYETDDSDYDASESDDDDEGWNGELDGDYREDVELW